MKKTSIIFIFCALLLTACSTTTKETPRQTALTWKNENGIKTL